MISEEEYNRKEIEEIINEEIEPDLQELEGGDLKSYGLNDQAEHHDGIKFL